MTRRTAVLALLAAALVLVPSRPVAAHCQVPCGIYHDHMRVKMMQEDATTIEKAIKQIAELSGKKDAQSQNQLVRWINTKEDHAEKVMRTIADYFMAQKITPETRGKAQAAYLKSLRLHHRVMVLAMKCKQTVDLNNVRDLRKAISDIEPYWKGK